VTVPDPLSPDCGQRKHTACTGDAWDKLHDQPAHCTCHCHVRKRLNSDTGRLRLSVGAQLLLDHRRQVGTIRGETPEERTRRLHHTCWQMGLIR
jgi:hypothetical protein